MKYPDDPERERTAADRAKNTEALTDNLRGRANADGIVELHTEDLAELLDNAGVAYFDHEKEAIRIYVEPFCMALLRWSVDVESKSHRAPLIPERQTA